MAKSAKGAGNLLVPLVVVAVAVVGVLVFTFWLAGEEPPHEETIIPEEENIDRRAGSGTLPEGAADENMEGVTDQLDEVDPAAPGVDTIPPAELATSGADDQTEGENAADEEIIGTANEPVVEGVPEGEEAIAPEAVEDTPAGEESVAPEAVEGGSEGEVDAAGQPVNAGEGGNTDAARLLPVDEGEEEGMGDTPGDDSFLIDENSDAPESAEFDTPGPQEPAEEAPAGRDAETNLTPEPGQDVVEDTDDGGTPFIPTPSGPEGRDLSN